MAYRVDPGRAPECFEYEVVDPDMQTLVKMRSGFMLASEGVTIPSTVTITGDYTVKATDRSVLVNTAAAVTITLPVDLPIGTPLGITRIVASANAITVARSGSDLIEGAATFVTHGAWAVATPNPAKVTLKKFGTNWRFVAGIIAGSNVNGYYEKRPDHVMEQWSDVDSTTLATPNANGAIYYSTRAKTFPVAFSAAPRVFLGATNGGELAWPGKSNSITANGFTYVMLGATSSANAYPYWRAIGPWYGA